MKRKFDGGTGKDGEAGDGVKRKESASQETEREVGRNTGK